MEFLEAAAHGCAFTTIYVFAIEQLNEKHRVFGNVLMVYGGSVGNLLFGIAVMFEHDFRIILFAFNVPGLLVFFYYLFVCESVRWLLASGRIDRAIMTMKRIAKFNRRELSEKTIETIKQKYSTTIFAKSKSDGNTKECVKNRSVLHLF